MSTLSQQTYHPSIIYVICADEKSAITTKDSLNKYKDGIIPYMHSLYTYVSLIDGESSVV